MSQQQHKGPFNYTNKHAKHTGTTTSGPGVGLSGSRQMPDRTIHHPPIAMYFIGGGGVLLGLATNGWQMFTTFIAFWSLLNPNGMPVDVGKQPMDFMICALIAVSFQFSLVMLVFRLDTTWKRKTAVNGKTARGLRSRAPPSKSSSMSTWSWCGAHLGLSLIPWVTTRS